MFGGDGVMGTRAIKKRVIIQDLGKNPFLRIWNFCFGRAVKEFEVTDCGCIAWHSEVKSNAI